MDDDILNGGVGADFFDCGKCLDTVIDFSPENGDGHVRVDIFVFTMELSDD